MRPLKLGYWRWNNERPIDRAEAFVKRLTREQPRTVDELQRITKHYLLKLCSHNGANVVIRHMFSDSMPFDLVFNGTNVDSLKRFWHRHARQISWSAFVEARRCGRQMFGEQLTKYSVTEWHHERILHHNSFAELLGHEKWRRAYKNAEIERKHLKECKQIINKIKDKYRETT